MAVNTRAGQLKVVSDLQREAHVGGTVDGQLPSAGLREEMSTVAATFSDVGNRIGQLADHAAAKEGSEAGRLAGLDPEFRPAKSFTIRAEAYDRAGLETHIAKSKIDMEADLSALQQKYPANPKALAEALEQKRQAWLGKALPEALPELTLSFEKTKLHYMREATRAQAQQIAHEQRATILTGLEEHLRGMQQRAFSLGLDGKADEAFVADMGQLSGMLRRRGPDGRPLFEPEMQAKLVLKAREEATTARLLGAFDRLGTVEEKAAFIKKFGEDFAKSEGLAKVYTMDQFRATEHLLEAGLRKAMAVDRHGLAQLRHEIEGTEKMADKGTVTPNDPRLIGLGLRVAQSKDPELMMRFQDAAEHITWQSQFRLARPLELAEAIRQETARLKSMPDATIAEGVRATKRLGVAERLLGEMQTQLKQDPLTWSEKQGYLPVPALDLSSPEARAASISRRITAAEEVARYYGQAPQYFRPQEAAQLTALMQRGGPEALAVAADLTAAAKERAPAMLAEIAKHGPAMAALGSLAVQTSVSGPTQFVSDAANGLALQKVKDFKPLVKEGPDVKASIQDVLGDALGHKPEDVAAAEVLANAAYEVQARRLNKMTVFDADLYKRLLREALGEHRIGNEIYGGIATYRGSWWGNHNVVVPTWVKQSGFGDLIRALRPEDVLPVAEDPGVRQSAPVDHQGRAIEMATLRTAKLLSVGDGQYLMYFGDLNSEPQWVRSGTANGDRYVLDLNKLRPALSRRRPDLVLGAR